MSSKQIARLGALCLMCGTFFMIIAPVFEWSTEVWKFRYAVGTLRSSAIYSGLTGFSLSITGVFLNPVLTDYLLQKQARQNDLEWEQQKHCYRI